MALWVGLAVLSLLTLASYLRGAWPLAGVGWVLVGLGALIGGDGGLFLIIGARCPTCSVEPL